MTRLQKLLRDARGAASVRLLGLLASLAVLIAIVVVAMQLTSSGGTPASATNQPPPWYCHAFPQLPACQPKPTETATPTDTSTPTDTATATATATDTPTATPTATATVTSTPLPKILTDSSPKAIIGGGTGGAVVTSSSGSFVPMFNTGVYASRPAAQQAMPSAGTVSHFQVRMSGSPGAGASYFFQLMLGNGFAPLFCSIAGGSSDCNAKSECQRYEVGDLITVFASAQFSPTPRSMSWTAIFTPNAECPD